MATESKSLQSSNLFPSFSQPQHNVRLFLFILWSLGLLQPGAYFIWMLIFNLSGEFLLQLSLPLNCTKLVFPLCLFIPGGVWLSGKREPGPPPFLLPNRLDK